MLAVSAEVGRSRQGLHLCSPEINLNSIFFIQTNSVIRCVQGRREEKGCLSWHSRRDNFTSMWRKKSFTGFEKSSLWRSQTRAGRADFMFRREWTLSPSRWCGACVLMCHMGDLTLVTSSFPEHFEFSDPEHQYYRMKWFVKRIEKYQVFTMMNFHEGGTLVWSSLVMKVFVIIASE